MYLSLREQQLIILHMQILTIKYHRLYLYLALCELERQQRERESLWWDW